jgi:hypothetical protein
MRPRAIIVAGDDDLLSGTINLWGDETLDGTIPKGIWSVTLPDEVKDKVIMWILRHDTNEWGQVVSGMESLPDYLPEVYQFKLEGIEASAALRDIEIAVAMRETTGSNAESSDKAMATVLNILDIERLSAPTPEDAEEHWSGPVNGSIATAFRVHLHSLDSGGQEVPAEDVTAQTYTINLGTSGSISQVTDSAGHVWTINGSTASLSLNEPLAGTSFDVTITFSFNAPGVHAVALEGTVSPPARSSAAAPPASFRAPSVAPFVSLKSSALTTG